MATLASTRTAVTHPRPRQPASATRPSAAITRADTTSSTTPSPTLAPPTPTPAPALALVLTPSQTCRPNLGSNKAITAYSLAHVASLTLPPLSAHHAASCHSYTPLRAHVHSRSSARAVSRHARSPLDRAGHLPSLPSCVSTRRVLDRTRPPPHSLAQTRQRAAGRHMRHLAHHA
ncbi:hypothetical protein FRC12_013923 [Ceratobasidium sp. 428]|nr:hypothetical protein FRC12_013923 [Ceratobasidium sp. 428]